MHRIFIRAFMKVHSMAGSWVLSMEMREAGEESADGFEYIRMSTALAKSSGPLLSSRWITQSWMPIELFAKLLP